MSCFTEMYLDGPVHTGFHCDGCNMNPLRGKRYKCDSCVDYDLCESCEKRVTHPQHHVFHLIREPSVKGLIVTHPRTDPPGQTPAPG